MAVHLIQSELYIIVLLIGIFASFVSTLAGFGSIIVLLPFLSLIIDIKIALPIVAIFHVVTNLSRVASFFRYIKWKSAFYFIISAIPATAVGASLIHFLPSRIIEFAVIIFLLTFAASRLVGFQVNIQASSRILVGGGGVYGLSAGAIGLGGAIRSTFLLSLNMKKENYVATSAIIATFTDATRIPLYLTYSIPEVSLLPLIIILISTAPFGVRIGKRTLLSISKKLFEKIVVYVIIIAALSLILKLLTAIF